MLPKSMIVSPLFGRTLKLHLIALTGLSAPFAIAQEISTETTEPVSTSTIANGAPADITITEDGSIELSGTEGQAAITIDSDNDVTHDGLIRIDDTNGVTGIRINPGQASNISQSGTIRLIEDYERTDDDDDDDLDGPFAIGEDRIGIHLEAGGEHTGNIELKAGSAIGVEGNDSSGILLQSRLNGDLILDSSNTGFTIDTPLPETDPGITIVGDNSIGIEVDEGVDGNVLLSGPVRVRGANARGVSLDGDDPVHDTLPIRSLRRACCFEGST